MVKASASQQPLDTAAPVGGFPHHRLFVLFGALSTARAGGQGWRACTGSPPPAPPAPRGRRLPPPRAAVRRAWRRAAPARGSGAAGRPFPFPVPCALTPQMPTSLAGTGDWASAGGGGCRTLRRAGEPGVGGRGRGRGARLNPARAPHNGGLLPSMAGPEAAALAQADGRDLQATSIAPTSSAGRQLPGAPTSGGGSSRERTATGPASGGVAVATARDAGLCEAVGLRARRGQGPGLRRRRRLAHGPQREQTQARGR